jgi:misacylated tRNA(Ala) deacylase
MEKEPYQLSGAGEMALDWERRYKLMRTHTALHLLCGVVFRDYGASVTGGDMDPLAGRMDFEFETMHHELVEEIQERVNEQVALARPVRVAILPRAEAFQIPDLIRTKINLLPEGIQQVRIVEIVGLDLQRAACTSPPGGSREDLWWLQSKGKTERSISPEDQPTW